MKRFSRRALFLSACLAVTAISVKAWTLADDRYQASQPDPFPSASAYPPGIQVEAVQVTLIKQVVVPAEEAGVIDSAMVKEGDLVKEGAILARIYDAEVQLERRKAQLEMDIAELRSKNDVNIRYAKKSSEVMAAELKRSEEAISLVKTAVSKTEIDRQRLAVEKTDLEIEQAELDLKEQELNYQLKANEYALATRAVERREIRSPLSGKIVEVSKQKGEWVEPGNQVFRIVEIDRLRVKGYLNINQLLGLSEGRPVTLFIEMPGRPRMEFAGKLVFISPEVNEVNGEQVEIWAEVENKDLKLRPGMHGTLIIQNPDVAAKE